jgi:hypothetical protein
MNIILLRNLEKSGSAISGTPALRNEFVMLERRFQTIGVTMAKKTKVARVDCHRDS